MIATMAKLLRALSPDESRMTAYLLSGRVGPSFSAPEFGLAQKLVEQAIAQACEAPVARIARMVGASGDLGSVAAALIDWHGSRPSVADVFNSLVAIAAAHGDGAQKAKIHELVRLLSRVCPVEGKYVVRTILGTHRIGVAEKTFLHALAEAFGEPVRDRTLLEQAYNCLSDLGEVAYRAARYGPASLQRVKPLIGVPVRMMLASRVADLDDVPNHLKGELFAEYKYDGERTQIHKNAHGRIAIFSRRLENITGQYPEIVAHVQRNLHARTAIIEGEAVAVDRRTKKMLPFQVVMRRKRKHDIERLQKEIPVAVFLFDCLYLDGTSLLSAPLSKRKNLLMKHMKTDAVTCIGTFIRTDEMSAVERYFHDAVARGAEGVVIKGASTRYEAGERGWSWIKFKREYQKDLADTFDVVIVGALYGKGSRAGSYGSILVAAYDPKTNKYYSFTKVGAGLDARLLARLPKMMAPYVIPRKHRLLETTMKMNVWFEPAKVIEIMGADLTVSPVHTVARDKVKSGGIALRFPRFVRMRDDKSPEQTTSVPEIWRMYRSGRAK
jgi:DNA ligase 1